MQFGHAAVYFLLVAHYRQQRATVAAQAAQRQRNHVAADCNRAVTGKNTHQQLRLELAIDNFQYKQAAFVGF